MFRWQDGKVDRSPCHFDLHKHRLHTAAAAILCGLQPLRDYSTFLEHMDLAEESACKPPVTDMLSAAGFVAHSYAGFSPVAAGTDVVRILLLATKSSFYELSASPDFDSMGGRYRCEQHSDYPALSSIGAILKAREVFSVVLCFGTSAPCRSIDNKLHIIVCSQHLSTERWHVAKFEGSTFGRFATSEI